MTRAEKARRIAETLMRLYPTVPIPLDHTDPFTLLVAVLLSAQTTDKKVNQVTPALFAEAGTPEAMAALPVERIHQLIREVGLAPQKAKNLSGLAKKLVAEHGGAVPRTFEALEALPGVGHKTASVVMAQAFGVPTFPVDTHILRLAGRWGLSDGTSVERTEADLKKTFPESEWNDLHLRIIYFGREHCPALRHDTTQCPICSWAGTRAAHAESKAERTKKKSAPGPKTKKVSRGK
jgi:endonuclease-3